MVKSQHIFTTLGASNHSTRKRQVADYYATDPSAIDDLFFKESFDNAIWEPACGEGHLSKRMEDFNKYVYSTDLIDRGFGDDFFNFLSCNKAFDGDIITNPPYKYGMEFVNHAMELVNDGNKVAMFLKLTFLEGKARQTLFKKYPPIRIYVYSFRKPVAINGEQEYFNKSSAACYAWFVWQKGYTGSPEIHWI